MAEKEYIEREAINNVLNELTVNDSLYNALQAIPAADVVLVVRCRDCAIPHNRFTGCPKLNGLIPPENHFCSYGERKENYNG